MSWFHYFVVFTLLAVALLAVILVFHYKNRLKSMSGMILSMAMGTNVGLTAGVVFGSVFKGDLFISTIYSILAGIVAGTACGLVLGILPFLEGFMAGLMGGMMGAMLGEMIGQDQSVIMINLFLTLSVSTLLLFQILPRPSEKESHRFNKKWLIKPCLAFFLLSTYLLWGSQLDKQVNLSKSHLSDNDGHITHNSQSSAEEKQQVDIIVSVQPSQFSYDPPKIVLNEGQQVSLVLKNNDSIDHDIEIKHIPLETKMEGNHEDHSIKDVDFHLHATALEQANLTFTPLQAGTYEFYCTIPGHKEKGMSGFVIVS